MALNQYRVWIRRGPEKEDYEQFKDMAGFVEWYLTAEKPEHWGFEKYDNDSWVDAFYSEDIFEILRAMRGWFVPNRGLSCQQYC
ncbi:MAG: hypothetical protein ACXABF_13855 [Candidatus Thorarchaeota archaeon]|jgi:hypothetical protein